MDGENKHRDREGEIEMVVGGEVNRWYADIIGEWKI